MAKKVKKTTTSIKKIDTDVNEIKINKKKKQKGQDKNKVAIIKDRNEFKSKSKKNKYKLAKKFKQIPEKEKQQAVANLVKSNSVKVLDTKDKSQNIKTRFQSRNKKQRRMLKNSDRRERKEHNTRMKNIRSNNKTDNDSVKKVLKEKESKSMKRKRNEKETNNNTTKFDSTTHKAKKQKIVQKRDHNSKPSTSHHKLDIKRLKKLMDIKEEETKGQQENTKPQKRTVKQKATKGQKENTKLQSLRKRIDVKQKDTKDQKENVKPQSLRKRIDVKQKDAKDQKENVKPQSLREQVTIKEKTKRNRKENMKPSSLRERMMTKLRASRFRYINESLYSSESSESKNYFKTDPDAFKAYHEGYKQQVEQWPLNPLDVIVTSIKKMSKNHIIADFGCGEAKLAASVPHKVHSFDFVPLNENVTACDMAHTPLLTNGVNVVVFCLSLMGTNLKDYIIEANRVLKKDGILKIAEVESRFTKVEDFIKTIESYGFKNTWKDLSHNLFYFLDFKKQRDIGSHRNKLPPITLSPCLYKKR